MNTERQTAIEFPEQPEPTTPVQWTETMLVAALREVFPKESYALLPQVRNATGAQRTVRTADAICMSLWPSRGLEIFGFEAKVSRADWRKELADPAKAEEIQRYCDRWYICASDEKIVPVAELPPTWGLIAIRAGKPKVIRHAPKLNAQPISKEFFAALMRAVQESAGADSLEVRAAQQQGYQEGKESVKSQIETARNDLKKLRDQVKEFEAAAEISIANWQAGRIGQAVRMVLAGDNMRVKDGLSRLLAQTIGIKEAIEMALKGEAK